MDKDLAVETSLEGIVGRIKAAGYTEVSQVPVQSGTLDSRRWSIYSRPQGEVLSVLYVSDSSEIMSCETFTPKSTDRPAETAKRLEETLDNYVKGKQEIDRVDKKQKKISGCVALGVGVLAFIFEKTVGLLLGGILSYLVYQPVRAYFVNQAEKKVDAYTRRNNIKTGYTALHDIPEVVDEERDAMQHGDRDLSLLEPAFSIKGALLEGDATSSEKPFDPVQSDDAHQAYRGKLSKRELKRLDSDYRRAKKRKESEEE